ncbi:MAG TPA: hypothetical protein VLK84_32760 [Longimicrobium sp.]|nr:hypothetical protein [Longimicrobium sp.]
MGEAARRKAAGFDGPEMGRRVLAALNEQAGGPVWELLSGGDLATEFLILDPEKDEVRAGLIKNKEAAETPHRVVAQTLYRRAEPWLTAMIFDPREEYRADFYRQMGMEAVRVAHGLMGEERIDEVRHVITTSPWKDDQVAFEVVPDTHGIISEGDPG